MRVYYGNTITKTETDGSVTALANVDVEIRVPGTTTKVSAVYASRNPADLTPLQNPIRTGATGYVEFWAEPGDYDLFIHDTIAPARIGDKTIGWAAVPGGDRGIPSVKVAQDGGLGLGAMDAAFLRQLVPLGTVIDWWRPASSYDAGGGAGNPPPGWAVCNGQVIASGQHDMGGGTLTLPDLRNKFILGADILKVDGGQSTNGDGTAADNAQHPNAPGIRGTGGANAGKDLRHTHGMSGHSHIAPDHTHNGVDHLHGVSIYTGLLLGSSAPANQSSASGAFAATNHYHLVSGGTGAADRGLQCAYMNATHGTALGTGAPNVANTDNGTAASAADMRPAHFGLLKIMKVRRT